MVESENLVEVGGMSATATKTTKKRKGRSAKSPPVVLEDEQEDVA